MRVWDGFLASKKGWEGILGPDVRFGTCIPGSDERCGRNSWSLIIERGLGRGFLVPIRGVAGIPGPDERFWTDSWPR